MFESKENHEAKLSPEEFQRLQGNIKKAVCLYQSVNKGLTKKQIEEIIEKVKVLQKAIPNPFKVLQDKIFSEERRILRNSLPLKHCAYLVNILADPKKDSPQESQLLSESQKKCIKKNLEDLLNSVKNPAASHTANGGALRLISAPKGDIKQINQYVKDGITALHIAAQTGDTEAVKLLIHVLKDHPEEINKGAKDGVTALHIATQTGHTAIVKQLIRALKGDVEQINKGYEVGTTALQLATGKGHIEVVELLIHVLKDHPEQINKGNEYGITALHIAAQTGHTAMVKLLIRALKGDVEQINKGNEYGITALHIAAQTGDTEAVKLLIHVLKDHPEQINKGAKDGITALHIAAEAGHTAMVKQLIRALKGDVEQINKGNEVGITALHQAVFHGKTEVAKLLIDALKDHPEQINKGRDEGLTALHQVVAHGKIEVAKLLIDALKDHPEQINKGGKDGVTALQLAVSYGKTEVAKLLIDALKDHPEQINKGAKDGITTLHTAAQAGHTAMVKQLIRALKGDVEQINKGRDDGITALQLAVSYGKIEVAKLLIDALKDHPEQINVADNYGMTALSRAIQAGHEETVRALIHALNKSHISNGLNGKADDKDSKATAIEDSLTPLHIAALFDKISLVETLLTLSQLNVNASFFGATVLEFAVATGNLPLVVALLKHKEIDISLKNTLSQTALQCVMKAKPCNPNIILALEDKEKQAASQNGVATSNNNSASTPSLYAGRHSLFSPPAEQLSSVSALSSSPLSSSDQIVSVSDQPKQEFSFVAEWNKYREKLEKNSQHLKSKSLDLSSRCALLMSSSFWSKEDDKESKPIGLSQEELEKFHEKHYYPMAKDNIFQKSNKRIFVHVNQKNIDKLDENHWLQIESRLKSEVSWLSNEGGQSSGIKKLLNGSGYEFSVKGNQIGGLRLCSSSPKLREETTPQGEQILVIDLDQLRDHGSLNNSNSVTIR